MNYLKKSERLEQVKKDFINDIQLLSAEVQNKMLYAVTQKTAAEIIIERTDETKPNMNLQTWEKSRVRKTDVIIAKNYLVESEVKELERLVTMFLDYAENQAMKKIALKIDDWKEKVDTFLNFNEYNVLKTHGSVSIQEAKKIIKKVMCKICTLLMYQIFIGAIWQKI